MNGWFWQFAQGVLAFVVIWGLVSGVNGPLLKLLLHRVAKAPATLRLRLCFWLGLVPLMVACMAVVTLSVPGMAAAFTLEHCHLEHCGAHRPWLGSSAAAEFTLATCVLLAVGALVTLVLRCALRVARLRALFRLAKEEPRLQYWLLDTPRLMAWTIGMIQPRVMLSTGMRNALTEAQLERVLQHEFVHRQRKDNLWKFILGNALRFSPHRREILACYARDCETVCEQQVAHRRHPPQQVAAGVHPPLRWLGFALITGLGLVYLWSSTTAYHLVVEALFANLGGLATG